MRALTASFMYPRKQESLISWGLPVSEILNYLIRKCFSERLSTGKTVVIESYGRLRIAEMNNANKLALGIPIDINKATLEDLMLIDGVGEKTACADYSIQRKVRKVSES